MKPFYFVQVALLALLSSCGQVEKHEATDNSDVTVIDSAFATSQRPVITISEANTDLETTGNIERPVASEVVNPKFPLSSLHGIWTYDPDGPHADFELNEKWFFVVDYDGDGDMPYLIKHDSIIVYYNDFIARGHIKQATGDTLKISWDRQNATEYVRWTQ